MNAIRAVVGNRRIEVPAPSELPDGAEVLVELRPVELSGIGMCEADWRDDAAALADWSAWLPTIEPVAFAPPDDFDEAFRRFNLDAVRRQMDAGP